MKNYLRVCAEINLDAAAYNFQNMKENIAKDTQMIAVIKTDGYGHGAVPIAKMAEEYSYIWGFATSRKPSFFAKPESKSRSLFLDLYFRMLMRMS